MTSEVNGDYNQLRATDLSAMLFKDTLKMPSMLERDAGFCSGSSEIEDDYPIDRLQSSPSSTDASEDSVDIKMSSIVIPKLKRMAQAPAKSISSENDVPLKKRIKYESIFANIRMTEMSAEANIDNNKNPFRPWIPPVKPCNDPRLPEEAEVLLRHPAVTTLHRVPSDSIDNVYPQEQPLALVAKKSNESKIVKTLKSEKTKKKSSSVKTRENNMAFNHPNFDNVSMKETSSDLGDLNSESQSSNQRSATQRNYKNMTRERRIEANARERTRVHTISAAFDTLRQAVPSYSNTQKLSKLSVLRVACSYILTLSRMADKDYSSDHSQPSIADCLEDITKTVQTEGKARKRKDE